MKDEYEKQTHWAWGSYYLRSEFKGDNVVKTLCENCENREDCERAGLSKCREAWRHKRVAKSLCCEASALHAKKDDVPLKEKLLSHPITFGLWPDILRPSQGSSFRQEVYEKSTKIQRKILTLLAFERNKKQICEELGMTEHSLNEHLSQIKKTVKKCQKTLTLSS